MKLQQLLFRYIYLIAFVLITLLQLVKVEKLLSSHKGTVGAGNYSYFYLKEPGEITLLLHSLSGDADLYVSDTKHYASFTNFNMSSTTCGLDMVTIRPVFSRPVQISVYGHIHSPVSKYKLSAVLNYTGENFHFHDSGADFSSGFGDDSAWKPFQSFLWDILEILLKIIFEVIL